MIVKVNDDVSLAYFLAYLLSYFNACYLFILEDHMLLFQVVCVYCCVLMLLFQVWVCAFWRRCVFSVAVVLSGLYVVVVYVVFLIAQT